MSRNCSSCPLRLGSWSFHFHQALSNHNAVQMFHRSQHICFEYISQRAITCYVDFCRIPYLWNVVWTQLVINNQALPKCLSTSRSNVCPYVLNNIRSPLRLYFKKVASVIGSSILTSALHSSIFNAHMCTAPPRPRAFRPPPVFSLNTNMVYQCQ